MTEHYVTLFDNLFLPQGLALYESMKRWAPEFKLWILCVDEKCHQILDLLQLEDVNLLKLSEWETPELLNVKSGRTRGEYCWTLTPFAPAFVFLSDTEITRVTYVDADLWFRQSPAPIFDFFDKSGAGVLLTEHAYAPENDKSELSGRFCVQFMTFDRVRGEPVRKWWEEKCLEWCFNRYEDGKFGDQKYLDDWPVRFAELVSVLDRKEWALAPWNAGRYPYSEGIFWHFHGLRILMRGKLLLADCGHLPLPRPAYQNVYQPYVADLEAAIKKLVATGFNVRAQATLTFYEALIRVAKGVVLAGWRFRRLRFLRIGK